MNNEREPERTDTDKLKEQLSAIMGPQGGKGKRPSGADNVLKTIRASSELIGQLEIAAGHRIIDIDSAVLSTIAMALDRADRLNAGTPLQQEPIPNGRAIRHLIRGYLYLRKGDPSPGPHFPSLEGNGVSDLAKLVRDTSLRNEEVERAAAARTRIADVKYRQEWALTLYARAMADDPSIPVKFNGNFSRCRERAQEALISAVVGLLGDPHALATTVANLDARAHSGQAPVITAAQARRAALLADPATFDLLNNLTGRISAYESNLQMYLHQATLVAALKRRGSMSAAVRNEILDAHTEHATFWCLLQIAEVVGPLWESATLRSFVPSSVFDITEHISTFPMDLEWSRYIPQYYAQHGPVHMDDIEDFVSGNRHLLEAYLQFQISCLGPDLYRERHPDRDDLARFSHPREALGAAQRALDDLGKFDGILTDKATIRSLWFHEWSVPIRIRSLPERDAGLLREALSELAATEPHWKESLDTFNRSREIGPTL
jgi:hypothetical protein